MVAPRYSWRLFDAAGRTMDVVFADYWDRLAGFAPSGIRDSYGMMEWRRRLMEQAMASRLTAG